MASASSVAAPGPGSVSSEVTLMAAAADDSSAGVPDVTLVTKWPCALSMARRHSSVEFSLMAQRRFLIASSVARLIRKEGDMVGRIVEGYFPARPDRDHFVSLEPGHSYLVLAPAKKELGRRSEPRCRAPKPRRSWLCARARWVSSARSCGSRAARRPSCSA